MVQLPVPPEKSNLSGRLDAFDAELTDARVQRAPADAPLEETRAAVAAGRTVVLAAGSVAAHAARHVCVDPPAT